MFPPEIIFAHLKNYEIKIVSDDQIALNETEKGSVCFVKLYLLEKEILEPLSQHLKKQNGMELKPIASKCSGLRVMTPVHKARKSSSEESILYMNEKLIKQIYELYREYIANFSPNLNSC
jgi:hypothetical protein